jgi:hypothetical protein
MIKNFILGVLFVIIGIIFNVYSFHHNIGTVSEMGPGFFPFLISSVLIITGLVLTITSIKWKF